MTSLPQYPLDDQPDGEVRDATLLLWWLRQQSRPWHFTPGTFTWRLALDLEAAGYLDLVDAGGEDFGMTIIYRAELRRGRRRVRR